MKRCSICKAEKSFSEFNKHAGRKDGLQPHCRECNRERSRAYYNRNPRLHIKNVRQNKAKYVAKRKEQLIAYLLEHPCVDCGNTDIRVLEFDHLRDKERNISKMLATGCGWDRISAEIEKCEVVCANCHRIRTGERGGWYRNASVADVGMAPNF